MLPHCSVAIGAPKFRAPCQNVNPTTRVGRVHQTTMKANDTLINAI